MKIETALLSAYDKSGLVELGRELARMGIRILSTGGSALALTEAGVPVTGVSDYTGFPEILDGRVKTLHPWIHAGILARHESEEHREVLRSRDILPIGLVAVNLYPFVETVRRDGVTPAEAIEQIDIGGPTMIRAAAKNHDQVTVVVDPGDYRGVLEELRENAGETLPETRRRLARKAFHQTAAYDAAIAGYLDGLEGADAEGLPSLLGMNLSRVRTLRYGENPHQKAALYAPMSPAGAGLVGAIQHQGKELSFNNYLDLEAAWNLSSEFQEPACAIIKHTNPCGAAVGSDPAEAYQLALDCDPVSAFGSIVSLNRPVDARTARKIGELFVEAVIAPGYEAAALEVFGKKKNLRVMEMLPPPAGSGGERSDYDFKKVSGGFLVQERDRVAEGPEDLKTVTDRAPEGREEADLLFAWRVAKHVKSNAIVLARGGQTLGIGAGQMSRVDSVKLAVEKSRLPLADCVMASDGFFPFRDAVDEAAQAGVRAVIQPGGSIRDEEAVAAANEHGMAMVMTGRRHFRH